MKHVFLDLDDTVNFTRSIMVDLLFSEYNYRAPRDIYLTSDNTSGLLGKILDSGEFMKIPRLNDGFCGLFAKIVSTIGVIPSICTHRGYHKRGKEFTYDFLDALGISNFLGEVILLDPGEYPNKLEFIQSKMNLKDGEFIIVDDKPNFFSNKPLCNNTILFDQYWNRDISTYSKYHRVTSLAQVIPFVDQLAKD